MRSPEVQQIELLAHLDDIHARLNAWADESSSFGPVRYCQAVVRRLLGRVELLRIRLESPLVVATFGGTGTGKSSLVNALVGAECTRIGRERPTTTRPVLLAHPDVELQSMGIPLDEFIVVRQDSELLRDLVIIDCPDPDTTETETPGSNLELLHRLLPLCDVLIYTSTQQKYNSNRVFEELMEAAQGCRLLFVQTHADTDADIRDDWRARLADDYDVPEMFFVDSVRGFQEQQRGQRPTGDLGRLQDVLKRQLGASQRLRIRRANLVDLTIGVLSHCRSHLAERLPAIRALQHVLEVERQKMAGLMAERLKNELLVSRGLWERRLVEAVTSRWGLTPFSGLLRIYHGFGSLVASVGLFRARNSAQVALIGALQGMRWLSTRQREADAEGQLSRLSAFGLDDTHLRETQLIVAGHVRSAGLDPTSCDAAALDRLRNQAVNVENEFLGDASVEIDQVIEDVAKKNSGFLSRLWYEALLSLFVGYVLVRIGRNFFYDSFFDETRILKIDFYVTAAVIGLLWAGFLVMIFTTRLRRGLTGRIQQLAERLAGVRLASGLFPGLEASCRQVLRQSEELADLNSAVEELRDEIAHSGALGSLTPEIAEWNARP